MNMEERSKIGIWEEMEEDLRKKYKQPGRAYQEPPTAEESLDRLEEIGELFVKYAKKLFPEGKVFIKENQHQAT